MESKEEGLVELQKERRGKVSVRTMADLSGLALKWDDCSVIRQRMRKQLNLVIHYDSKLKKETNFEVARSVRNVKANHAALNPLCHLIRSHRMVPNIDSLANEVRKLFDMNNQPIQASLATSQAWNLRHLIAILRGTIRTDKFDKSKKIFPKDSGSEMVVVVFAAILKNQNIILMVQHVAIIE